MYIVCKQNGYINWQSCALIEQLEFFNFIIDDVEEVKIGIPYYFSEMQYVPGLTLEMKLWSVLEHIITNKLCLFTLTQDWGAGADDITDTAHHFLMPRYIKGLFLKFKILHMNKCTIGGRGSYIFECIKSMGAWRLLYEVELSFLPVESTCMKI